MTRDFDDWQDSKKWKDLQDAGMIGVGRCYDSYKLEERVKALEQYRNDHKETTKFNHGALCDILDRLKSLEDKENTYHESMMQGWNNNHHQRIFNIEQWQKGTGGSILSRIKMLEEWKQGQIGARFHQRLDKLEEWKNLESQCNSDESAMKGMFIQELQNKVKALEEWKQRCAEGKGTLQDIHGVKTIDKQVWDDINGLVKKIELDIDNRAKWEDSELFHNVKRLKELLK